MIQPVVKKFNMNKRNEEEETINYWLSKTPEERINAMGTLHKQLLIIKGYKQIPRIKKCVKKVKTT